MIVAARTAHDTPPCPLAPARRYSAPMALEDELAKLTKRAARKGGQRRGLGVFGGVLLIGGALVALICLIIVASGFSGQGRTRSASSTTAGRWTRRRSGS